LYGTGLGNELEGLAVAAAEWGAPTINNPINNLYDVVVDGSANLAVKNYQPSGAMVHPTSWFDLITTTPENGGGHYIVPDLIRQGLAPAQLAGVPIIRNTA